MPKKANKMSEATVTKVSQLLKSMSDLAEQMTDMTEYLDTLPNDEFDAAQDELEKGKEDFLSIYRSLHIIPNIFVGDLRDDWDDGGDEF